jgi:D-aminoacyl-tRNA deacylase
MRTVIQRVQKANVSIGNQVYSSIATGLLILLGVEEEDTEEDVNYLATKILNLRIFADDEGKMNKSVLDINGEILVVSQFTLHALTKKGNRPSFIKAAKADKAIPLYDCFITQLEQLSLQKIKTGKFGADMQIELINDGPVTILIDSKSKE